MDEAWLWIALVASAVELAPLKTFSDSVSMTWATCSQVATEGGALASWSWVLNTFSCGSEAMVPPSQAALMAGRSLEVSYQVCWV